MKIAGGKFFKLTQEVNLLYVQGEKINYVGLEPTKSVDKTE